jgi:SEC-C motif
VAGLRSALTSTEAAGGSPSESRVKRGDRIVGSGTELIEKLGRDDPCPCGSGHRFPPLLPQHGPLRRHLVGYYVRDRQR